MTFDWGIKRGMSQGTKNGTVNTLALDSKLEFDSEGSLGDRLKKALPLSLLLHALLVALLFYFAHEQPLTKDEDDFVEVTLVPPSVAPTRQRIVDSNKGQETKQATPDSFLGEKTRTVDEQTVSKEIPSLEEKPRARQQQQAAKPMAKGQAVPLSKLGVPLFRKKEQGVDQPNFVDYATGLQKMREDYVKGIKESGETALNTREYVFFGYFKRIRESLDRAWRPILRDHIAKIYRKGRHLASAQEHTTRTLVTLNDAGKITRVQILEESGTRDLDNAAVQAFNRAGPFPNPPRGLIDDEGEIKIRWDFVLRT